MAGRGLLQWRGYREWDSYSSKSGLTNDLVYEIAPRDDGSIWVATEGGLFHGERKQRGLLFKPVAGIDNFPVHSVHALPSGDLWLGTETRGVARLDPRTQKLEWFGDGQGLTGKAAYSLCIDSEQNIWVASEVGLFVAHAPYRAFSRVAELPSTRFWNVTFRSPPANAIGTSTAIGRNTPSGTTWSVSNGRPRSCAIMSVRARGCISRARCGRAPGTTGRPASAGIALRSS